MCDRKGLRLLPDASLADAKPIDLLIVPGGPVQEDLMEDKQVLSFLTAQAGRAKCVFSVCTGALLCSAAGLLKGLEVTTHWQSVHNFHKKALALGFELVPQPEANTVSLERVTHRIAQSQ